MSRKFVAKSNFTSKLYYLFIDDSNLKYETDYDNFYDDSDIIEIDKLTYDDIIKGLNHCENKYTSIAIDNNNERTIY